MSCRTADTCMWKGRRSLILSGFLILSAFWLTSCNPFSEKGVTIHGTTFYFTQGIDDAAVMKNGEFSLNEGQIRLLLNSVRKGYSDILTADIWEMDIEGRTFSDYVEDAVQDMAARLLLVNMMAAQKGITLTEQEQEAVSARAEAFYEEREEELSYISKADTEQLFLMLELSDKTYDELTQNVNTEISMDEARIIKIQYIYSRDSIKKLQNAMEELEEGYEFLTIAAKYSDSQEYTAEIGRGELISEFEETAFNLDEGQVSGILTCDNGYYIIKCINDNVEDKVEAQREKILQARREEQFMNFFSAYAKNAYLYFDQKKWQEICGSTK